MKIALKNQAHQDLEATQFSLSSSKIGLANRANFQKTHFKAMIILLID